MTEAVSNTDSKEFTALQARFARLGRELARFHRSHDGRVSYVVSRWGEPRYMANLGDVKMHLHALERASHG